jgi:hypothetical protein
MSTHQAGQPMSRWITIEAERVLYVDRGRDVILVDGGGGRAGSVTLVLKVAERDAAALASHPSENGAARGSR